MHCQIGRLRVAELMRQVESALKARALSVCLAAVIASVGCAPMSGAEEPEYGVCRKQVIRYVEERLGQTVTRVDIKAYADRSTPGHFDLGNALVFVQECHGFHSFEIHGTWSECEHLPHYGSGADYIYYEGPFGRCKSK